MKIFNQQNVFIVCCLAMIALSVGFGSLAPRPANGLNQQLSANVQTPNVTPAQWKPVEQAMGKSGTIQPGGVFKFGFPRRDLQVMVDGVKIKPTLALGSWVAFKQMGNEAMVMGDLVLTQAEVTPVMTQLQQGGIEQAALHNHVPNPLPVILYMHIQGQGNPVKLAESIHAALVLTKTPLTAPPPGNSPQELELDSKQLDQILGSKGKVNGGVYQFNPARAEKIMESGMEIPPSMGTAHALNFQPTGGGKAAITGDFVLTANEVNPVIRALRSQDIEVTALHSHMLNEEPLLFYMHFWANDDAAKLARGLRVALDKTNLLTTPTTPKS